MESRCEVLITEENIFDGMFDELIVVNIFDEIFDELNQWPKANLKTDQGV